MGMQYSLNRKAFLVKKIDNDNEVCDIDYWLSKSFKERLEAAEFLRRQKHGDYSGRLQRVFAIVKLSES